MTLKLSYFLQDHILKFSPGPDVKNNIPRKGGGEGFGARKIMRVVVRDRDQNTIVQKKLEYGCRKEPEYGSCRENGSGVPLNPKYFHYYYWSKQNHCTVSQSLHSFNVAAFRLHLQALLCNPQIQNLTCPCLLQNIQPLHPINSDDQDRRRATKSETPPFLTYSFFLRPAVISSLESTRGVGGSCTSSPSPSLHSLFHNADPISFDLVRVEDVWILPPRTLAAEFSL